MPDLPFEVISSTDKTDNGTLAAVISELAFPREMLHTQTIILGGCTFIHLTFNTQIRTPTPEEYQLVSDTFKSHSSPFVDILITRDGICFEPIANDKFYVRVGHNDWCPTFHEILDVDTFVKEALADKSINATFVILTYDPKRASAIIPRKATKASLAKLTLGQLADRLVAIMNENISGDYQSYLVDGAHFSREQISDMIVCEQNNFWKQGVPL